MLSKTLLMQLNCVGTMIGKCQMIDMADRNCDRMSVLNDR